MVSHLKCVRHRKVYSRVLLSGMASEVDAQAILQQLRDAVKEQVRRLRSLSCLWYEYAVELG